MTSAPNQPTSDSPNDLQARAEAAPAPAPGAKGSGLVPPVRGRVGPRPLGRLARGLWYGTGVFLLRPLFLVAQRLVGWRRTAQLRYQDGVLEVEHELALLGMTLRRETELLPSCRLASVSRLWTRAPEPLAWGALGLGIAVVWGLWQVVDGLYGRSFALVGLGLGVMAAGAAVDLILYFMASRLTWLDSHGLVVRMVDGRELAVLGLPEAHRDRIVAALFQDIK